MQQNDLGGGGVWKNSHEVLFYLWNKKKLASLDVDTGQIIEFSTPLGIDVYVASENQGYLLSDKVYRYVLGAAGYETRPVSWSPYEANDFTGKHLSGDGGRVVMSWRGAEADGIGVYTLDTATSEIRQIR